MLRLMFPHFISALNWKEPFNWKDFLDEAAHVAQLIGFAVAGVWGYFNFVKSRTYYPRMELSASGKLLSKGEQQFLIPRVTLKNIGNSKISLQQRGTGYRIWVTKCDVGETGELGWSDGQVVHRIFEEHRWIEPGEMIFDELRMFAVPNDCVATKVEVRLTACVGLLKSSKAWTCSAIVGPGIDKGDNQ